MAMQPISLTGGMRANLVSLQNTNALLENTQKRLATGKKVNSALDDPVAYFTSMAHEQRATDLAGRKDQMSESIQMVKAANAGIESIRTLIEAAKSLATAASSSDVTSDITALNTQYNVVRTQIDEMAADSGYKGINLLKSGTTTVKFDEDGTSKLTLTGFDATTAGTLAITASTWASPAAAEKTKMDADISPARQSCGDIEDRIEQAVQQPEHHHRTSGVHPGHDQHPEGRCGRADQRRHERGRRQHADAPDPTGSGHDIVEPRLPGGPVGPETVLS